MMNGPIEKELGCHCATPIEFHEYASRVHFFVHIAFVALV